MKKFKKRVLRIAVKLIVVFQLKKTQPVSEAMIKSRRDFTEINYSHFPFYYKYS